MKQVDTRFIGPLPGSSRECLSVLYATIHPHLLILVSDETRLDPIGQNLKTFASLLNLKQEILSYPFCGFGTPQFDRILFNEKTRSLLSLQGSNPLVIVSSAAGIRESIPFSSEGVFTLKFGSSYERETLVKKIFQAGYERVNYVEQPGEFAVRGGIVDVYGMGNESPVRMEFFGDSIDLLKKFDPSTQRTTEDVPEVTIQQVLLKADPTRQILPSFPDSLSVFFYDEALFQEMNEDFNNKAVLSETEFPYLLNPFPGKIIKTPYESADFDQWPGQNRIEVVFDWMQKHQNDFHSFYISCGTKGEHHRLTHLISEHKKDLPVSFVFISDLLNGFICASEKWALFSDTEIYRRFQTRYKGFCYGKGVFTKPAEAFEEGDYVVHYSYGIGIYRGLKPLDEDGSVQEVMVVEYADESRLYVPSDQFYLLEKYVGTGGEGPSLDTLGSARWANKKAAAQEAICDYAAKILKTEAARELMKTEPLYVATPEMHDFEHSFPFQETPDQERSIEEVKKDLTQEKPMHRLVLGDAGYGKTEVAIRAAFLMALQAKQTAVLVPTTLLAEQHFQTFSSRMGPYPFRVEVLSRFSSQAQQKKIINDLRTGGVDILIGTHRMVQKDVVFKDMGLLVIDEEQRFGVMHKDFLLHQNPSVHILTLSATPIPRTLYLSLMGARDMSAIMTAPQERRPIETKISEEDPFVIKTAIEAELKRNGQVFFVHNRIHSIQKMHDLLTKLVPSARFQ
ncbi:MAG: DEAD/DEAH box helicase, partial [Candidatus Aureabacteria bacterium]|nr:DEAD/DEAH box helicase [Candidatus Auribacterota bacterium]